MFKADVLADSTFEGQRITTFSATFPRSILPEFYTHAMVPCLRKNLSSSRAIPTAKLMQMVLDTPFVPEFALNKAGMQAGELLEEKDRSDAEAMWESHKLTTLQVVGDYQNMKVHKQYANRLLEPWMWCTAIMTATDWPNFFAQRYHKAAEPSFQKTAKLMWEAMCASEPVSLDKNGWHLPLFTEADEFDTDWTNVEMIHDKINELHHAEKLGADRDLLIASYTIDRLEHIKQDVSAARCARVSYLTHAGIRDVKEDVIMALKLSTNDPGHWSPFEHVATPAQFNDMRWKPDQLAVVQRLSAHVIAPLPGEKGYCGAFKGFKPYRHFFANENHTVWEGPASVS